MRNKQKTFVCLTAALMICLGLIGNASADIIWNQPQGMNWAAFCSSTYFSALVADDFQLNTAASVLSVGWAGGANGPFSVNGFHIRFYENDYYAGYPPYEDDLGQPAVDYHRPGEKVYDQYIPIGNVIVSAIGNPSTATHFNYKANLPVSFNADADIHYWFSVQAETGEPDPWWGWLGSETALLDYGTSNGKPLSGEPWYGTYGHDFTYSLDSSPAPVPIPPSVWLLGSGLIGLVGLRRRFIRK